MQAFASAASLNSNKMRACSRLTVGRGASPFFVPLIFTIFTSAGRNTCNFYFVIQCFMLFAQKKDPLILTKFYDPITWFEWYPLKFNKKGNEFFWFLMCNWKGQFWKFDLDRIIKGNNYPFTTTSRIKKLEYKTPVHFSELFGDSNAYPIA